MSGASSWRRSRIIRGRAGRCSTSSGSSTPWSGRVPALDPAASAEAHEHARQLRGAARREQSIAIVDAIRAWAFRQRALPESSLGKAIAYMLGLWAGLTRFLGDARIPLDNNATERGLRGMVVGRKNHYGSRSKRGTEVAALFYSLIETAKLAGVNPKTYLLAATHAALRTPAPRSCRTLRRTDLRRPSRLPPRPPWGSASPYTLLALLPACSTIKQTPGQDYVWAMGRICDGRVPLWKMDRVDTNGNFHIRPAANMIPSPDNDYFKCMKEFKETPYQQWLKTRPDSG